jgi:hypothetical protein
VGQNLQLSATDRPGYTFSWTGPNGFASTQAQPIVTSVTTANGGSYTVAFASPGCGNASRTANVIVNNPALVTANATTPVCAGGVVYFSGSAHAGSTYQWNGPNGYFNTRQSPAITNIQLSMGGVYTYTVTMPGCGPVQATVNVTVLPCKDGIFETEESATEAEIEAIAGDLYFKVWPNPTEGKLKATLYNAGEGKYHLEVLDVLGHVVLIPGTVAHTYHTEWDLNLSTLSKGVYLVRVSGEGYEKIERVMLR